MDQKRQQDLDRPNQNANKEPAEGSRETVRDDADVNRDDQGGGITNRPLGREQKEQSEVPPRGKTKDEVRNDDPVMPADDATLNTKI